MKTSKSKRVQIKAGRDGKAVSMSETGETQNSGFTAEQGYMETFSSSRASPLHVHAGIRMGAHPPVPCIPRRGNKR